MKRGIAPGLLVGIIILAVFLFIMVTQVLPVFFETGEEAAAAAACNWAFLKHKFNLGEISETECERHDVVVTKSSLDTHAAYEEMQKYQDSSIYGLFSQPGGDYAWAMDKVIADEMASCFEKTMGGKYTERGQGILPFSTDLLCVVCSRILIADDIKDVFRNTLFDEKPGGNGPKGIDPNLDAWMNTVEYKDGRTYKEAVTSRIKISNSIEDELFRENVLRNHLESYPAHLPDFRTNMTEALAVMLVNIPLGRFKERIEDTGNISDEPDVTWIQLYNYGDIRMVDFEPLVPGKAAKFWQARVEGGLKCKTVVG